MKNLLVLLLVLFVQPALAAMEVIELNWRNADELLPTVQSVLGQDGNASAYGQKLIVNAPPAKIRELRELLTQLDTRPRRLLISVDRGGREQGALNDFSFDGTISGGNAEIKIGQGEVGGKDQVRIIRSTSAGGSSHIQQIQTNEGYAALIQGGQSVPIQNTWQDHRGNTHQQTDYRDLNQGLYVTATVSGDQVMLDISNQHNRLSGSGQINLEQVATRVSGRLGQWIELGAIGSEQNQQGRDILRSTSGQSSSDMQLRVKVELLD
ncbi:hypothetical protein AXE65_10060 [Ventosimonas gracilis]|uniref:NolW-like domain-containing protein n=1 Tax=Ventosimonas gracilis TaxID=1680762 RepID=A0A139SXM6_9GAMM|nr:secretin N-terminal domain-containing protein [Ventosimonas gracilis]KXU39151.1 hypothetical protein AXE65_10060 [Ventosimonas gracilis]